MLILQIRARFFRSHNYRDSLPPFFPHSLAFFTRPNYRDSLPSFFPHSPAFFAHPQLPRVSPIFSSLARFLRSPPTIERVPLFFLARPKLPRAWNRLSENLQSSCSFSTQRIEKSILLAFDRDQYYVLPK